MPAYPCVKCNTKNDVKDSECKKCKLRTPFQCSKCNKTFGSLDVFEPEKLTFSKPLLCRSCGLSNEEVFCFRCAKTVVRANAALREQPGHTPLIYHPECLKHFEGLELISTGAMYLLVPLFSYVGYNLGAAQVSMGGVIGVFAGSALALFISRLIRPSK